MASWEQSFITSIPLFSHTSNMYHYSISVIQVNLLTSFQDNLTHWFTAQLPSCVCVCIHVYLLNIYSMWCLSCEFIELSPLIQCLWRKRRRRLNVCSGHHAVSHSLILHSSRKEIGLKNLVIYVISTLSICVYLSVWFPHHRLFFLFYYFFCNHTGHFLPLFV